MMHRRALLKLACAVFLSGASVASFGKPASASVKKLLFVHGRGQGGSSVEVLKAQWMASLTRGAQKAHLSVPAGLDVAFPFYGDQLDGFVKNADLPLTSNAHARGDLPDDYLQFQGEVAEQIRQGTHISDEQVRSGIRSGIRNRRAPLNWPWVQAILRAIDKHGGGMNMQTLQLFTRDVYLYVTREDVHDAINLTVASKLSEEPTVIVAHSLGTVVAYNILTTDKRNLQVPTFVTLGCPLGVRAIRERLTPLHYPQAVKSWFNAFDTRDVVALYPLDATNFPITPPVENDASVRNGTNNRHGIDGYLNDKTVATRVFQGMTS